MREKPTLRVDLSRLKKDLLELARIGRTSEGGVSRPALSPPDMRARRWLMERMRAAGLKVQMDGAGNVFGRLGGKGPAVLAGSHLDSVPDGGRFDGALGVLSALEAVRRIGESRLRTRYPIEVVSFTDEEGRFGGFLGSYALTGRHTASSLAERKDARGVPLLQAMGRSGFTVAGALRARRSPSQYRAYLELHIEQGPMLESHEIPIGVVTGIVGIHRYLVTFHGRADHAGTTPFPLRRDAYLGAAEFATRLRKTVLENGSGGSVATVGYIALEPGVSNIVPAKAAFTLDLRDSYAPTLKGLDRAVNRLAREVARRTGLRVTIEPILRVAPIRMSPRIFARIRRACQRLGVRCCSMVSGAGHDAQVMAREIPSGLFFVPSVDGRSHSPEELTRWRDVETGANVMLHTLMDLAGVSE